MKESETLICPFCEEGALKNVKCKKCGRPFLLCDECESVYKDKDTLDEDCWVECPHCGEHIDGEG